MKQQLWENILNSGRKLVGEEQVPSIIKSTPEINAARYLTVKSLGGNFKFVNNQSVFIHTFESLGDKFEKDKSYDTFKKEYFKWYNKIIKKDKGVLNSLKNDETYQKLLKFINK